MTGLLPRKQEDTETQGRRPCENGGRDEAKKCQRLPGATGTRGEAKKDLSHRQHGPANTLILVSNLRNVQNKFLLF